MSDPTERVAQAMVDAMERQESEDPANSAHIQNTALDLVGIHGNVDMLKVAAAAIEAMSDWQSIETAPKDGTWILVYEPSEFQPFVHVAQWGTTEPWGGRETWITYPLGPNPDTYDVDDATHWQPLPKPPSA